MDSSRGRKKTVGASMFLYHLGLIDSILSTVSYAESTLRMLRATNWFAGVLGGVVAARAFCALVFAGDAVPALGLGFLVTLGLVLPILTSGARNPVPKRISPENSL